MADIEMVCEACGHENTFSEYSLPESRICHACGKPVQGEQAVRERTLKLAIGDRERTTLTGQRLERPDLPDEERGQEIRPEDRRQPRQMPRSHDQLIGHLVFVLLCAVVVGVQYLATRGGMDALLPWYLKGRYVLLAAGWLIVVVEAAMDSHFKGLLAALFPPYFLFYALARISSFSRQSVFLALVVMLITEMALMRDEALITWANEKTQVAIESVSRTIDRAGSTPVDKLNQ